MEKLNKVTVVTGISILIYLLLFSLVPKESEAIPAFARNHKVGCSFCHAGYPKLNSIGIAFKQNGYRMPGEKGTYLWEKPIPLAFRLNFALPQYESRDWTVPPGNRTNVPPASADGATGETRTSVSDTALKIRNWQILSGGTLAPKVSYFFQIVGNINGQSSSNSLFPAPDEEPGSTEIESEAIVVQIDDILPDGLMNFRAGKDHIDNLFFSRPRRLTFASYTTMFQPITGGSLHANVIGVEVNGVHESTGIWYAAGMRNASPRYDSSDVNELRPGAFYGIFNVPFTMGDEYQTLGLLVARDKVGNENFGGTFPGSEASTFGAGGVLDLNWGHFNLMPAFYYYTEGQKAHGALGAFEATSGTVELHYAITPELIATGRWDFLDVIGQPAGEFEDGLDQFVFNLAWYFHPNVRFVAEYSFLDAKLNRLTTLSSNTDLYVSAPGGLGGDGTRADLEVNKFTLGFEVNF